MERKIRRKGFDLPRGNMGRCLLLAVLVTSAGAMTGCGKGGSGKPTAHLSGTVKIDGQLPPENAFGTISFRATTPGQAHSTSAQILKGKYDCPDVPQGSVMVFIQVAQPTGRTINDGGRQVPEVRNLIASKYNSGTTIEVTADNSNQDFDLTSGETASK